MSLTIGHIVERWLPPSDPWTYGLVRSLTGCSHEILTTRTEQLDQFPHERLRVCHSSSEYPELARWFGVDLLLCHGGPSGLAGLPVAQVCGVPIVTVFHGHDTPASPEDTAWLGRYGTLFRLGSHMLCLSDAALQRLLETQCPPDRACMIHPGVDASRYSPALRRRRQLAPPIHLLSVAPGIGDTPALTTLLGAVGAVRNAGHDVSLRLVTDDASRPAVERLRSNRQLDGYVTVVEAPDPRIIRSEISNADIMVHAGSTPAIVDDIPCALMQAMACQLPVVAAGNRGIPELVLDGESGLLVPEGDAPALTNALRELITSADFTAHVARGGRRWIEEEFSLKVQARRVGQFLEDVVAVYREAHPKPRSRWLHRDRVHHNSHSDAWPDEHAEREAA